MIVRSVAELIGTEREVKTPNWVSRRLLLKRDGMGFSLHETTVFAGTETYIWYRHHLEAVFCIEGEGEVEVLPEGIVYRITPGTVYALDRHDKHWLRAKTDMRLVCVFNPPLTGGEVHDEEGVYPLVQETAAASG
ncbi:MAG: L-ectoine synthase [Azospira oryzae]|uniref:L-ectoine synthase n=1 Tax=Pelomicrobium methylotrophicum TaxID=2602750 RepID=A0A5C7EP12_9PROT|nr:ectoine synthase [Pelomicrobium methylotrophicum]PZP64500.1 MAG: L-ectoine synthase [Azospira oryzae]PZP82463.1 MAG: L-ectoine synthase [Azospira oryzae]TXF10004.1 ectoine synthase [Pelomicrobium methylotrophicum]